MEENKLESFQRNEENRDWIYLIKPNGFTPDIVYKVFAKDNELYFCRVGGQFYGIREDSSLNPQASQKELLKTKKNYKIPRYVIACVKVDGKKSRWTGGIPNSGILQFNIDGKKQKYIIHSSESPNNVADFFQKNCLCDVQVVHIENYHELQQEILEGQELQNTDERFKAAIKVSSIFNIVSLVTGLWLLLHPHPYFVVVGVNIAVSIVSIAFAIKYKDYISYGKKLFRKRPEFLGAFFLSSIALTARAQLDFNVFYSVLFWIIIIVLSIVSTLLFILKSKLYKQSKGMIVIMLISMFAFFYGTSIIFNCRFDNSQAVKSQNKVLYMDSGKEQFIYYITITPWDTGKKPVNMHVDRSLYERIQIGEIVNVYQWRGLFGIPWFDVSTS